MAIQNATKYQRTADYTLGSVIGHNGSFCYHVVESLTGLEPIHKFFYEASSELPVADLRRTAEAADAATDFDLALAHKAVTWMASKGSERLVCSTAVSAQSILDERFEREFLDLLMRFCVSPHRYYLQLELLRGRRIDDEIRSFVRRMASRGVKSIVSADMAEEVGAQAVQIDLTDIDANSEKIARQVQRAQQNGCQVIAHNAPIPFSSGDVSGFGFDFFEGDIDIHRIAVSTPSFRDLFGALCIEPWALA